MQNNAKGPFLSASCQPLNLQAKLLVQGCTGVTVFCLSLCDSSCASVAATSYGSQAPAGTDAKRIRGSPLSLCSEHAAVGSHLAALCCTRSAV